MKILALHGIAFSLYLAGTLVYYVFYTIYYTHWESQARLHAMLIAWIFCTVFSFLAQICLCLILWLFSRAEPPTIE